MRRTTASLSTVGSSPTAPQIPHTELTPFPSRFRELESYSRDGDARNRGWDLEVYPEVAMILNCLGPLVASDAVAEQALRPTIALGHQRALSRIPTRHIRVHVRWFRVEFWPSPVRIRCVRFSPRTRANGRRFTRARNVTLHSRSPWSRT